MSHTITRFVWDAKTEKAVGYVPDPKRVCATCGLPNGKATKENICPWCTLSECRFERAHRVEKVALRAHYQAAHAKEVIHEKAQALQ